ncbi:hypothetical protein BGZ60DRAFT_92964 [Tricladium varicosporioides]|nr:hypothetical protein BGZ60DRAFT_92964 [Hymenoscyphus varicosporioides]
MGRSTIRWSKKNEIDLLANLDFVIRNIHNETGRYGTNEAVLQNLVSELPEPRRSQHQIDRKLKKFWKDHVTNPEWWNTHENLYRYGTSILDTLGSDLKDQIQEELDILESNQRLKAVGTPRKTRSESRTVAESSHAKSVRVASSECTPTKSRRKRQSQSPQHSTRKRIKQESLASKDLLTKAAPIVQGRIEVQLRAAARTTRLSPTDSESTLSSPPSLTSLLEEDNYRDSTLDGFQYSETPSQSFLYLDKFRGTPALDYDDTNLTIRISNTKIFTHGDETLLDLFNDIEYFRAELSKLEKVRRHMIESERVRQGIQTQILPGIVEERNETIAELKQRLKDQTFAQRLLGNGDGKQALPSRDKIKSSHGDMRKNIMGLSVLEDIRYTANEIRGVNSEDLNTLKGVVLSDIAQAPSLDDVSHSLDIWVQSLTGAAVCEWIFKESYQCTAMMNTPLLDGYRRSLSTVCNDEILRTVDSVAHQFVVDSHHFKEVFLPRTAKRLAKRLLNVLAPLVKGNYLIGEQDFEEDLEAIFRSALEIKTLGMTVNHVLEFIWPAQSTVFESDSMTEEVLGSYTSDRGNSDKKVKKVLLTLVPGLRVYSYERQFVDYCNFTSGKEKVLGKGELVAHTLVITH